MNPNNSISRTAMQRGGLAALLIVLAFLLTACPAVVFEPVSPPAELLAGPLIGKTWQVVEATYQGTPVRFDWYQPMRLTFTPDGALVVNTPVWCRRTGRPIFYASGGQYQLGLAMVPAIDCSIAMLDEGIVDCSTLYGASMDAEACRAAFQSEYDQVLAALEATNRYRVAGDHLTLTGPNSEIRLVLEAP